MSSRSIGQPVIRRVVIVDDSRTIQAILDNAFSERADFSVVGFSSDATMAAEMIRRLMPDVVTIDLNMPYIDGAALLGMIADLKSVCKIIVSDAPIKNLTLSANLLQAGAAICLGKTELASDPNKFFFKVNAAAAETKEIASHRPVPASNVSHSGAGVGHPSAVMQDRRYPVPSDERARPRFIRQKRLTNSQQERQFDLVTKHIAKVTGSPCPC